MTPNLKENFFLYLGLICLIAIIVLGLGYVANFKIDISRFKAAETSLPYPERSVFQIKSIFTDYWGNPFRNSNLVDRDPKQPEQRDEIVNNGLGGIALNLIWSAWEPTPKTLPCLSSEEEFQGRCYIIDRAVDEEIRYYSEKGVGVIGILDWVPSWASIEIGEGKCSPALFLSPIDTSFCAPKSDNIGDFARFAGMLAHRYNGLSGHGRIIDFNILNEVGRNEWFDIGCGKARNQVSIPCDFNKWIDYYVQIFNAAYDAIISQQPTAQVFIPFDHSYDTRWDRPIANPNGEEPSLSMQTFLGGNSEVTGFAQRVGNRTWRVVFHPYPANILDPKTSTNDLAESGYITFGNVGALSGWLYQRFGDIPAARELAIAEVGINSVVPGTIKTYTNESLENQSKELCKSFQNVLGTPSIKNYAYNHFIDGSSGESYLLPGLRFANGGAKLSWATWALVNRPGANLDCGFEDIPFVRLLRGYNGEFHWISSRGLPPGFRSEINTWGLLREKSPGTTLLFECQSGKHNFITRDPRCRGLLPLGPVGYIYTEYVPGTILLVLCKIADGQDHFVNVGGCNDIAPNISADQSFEAGGVLGYGFQLLPPESRKSLTLGSIRGRKVGPSPDFSIDDTVSANDISSKDNPYVFDNLIPGSYMVSVPRPSGTVGYTLCYNNTECHSNPPIQGNSVMVHIAAGTYADIYWHYTSIMSRSFSASSDTQSPIPRVSSNNPISTPASVAPQQRLNLRIDGKTSSTKKQLDTFKFLGDGYTPDQVVIRWMRSSLNGVTQLVPNELKSDNSGMITWDFNATCQTKLGKYTIWAVDSITGKKSNNVTEVVKYNPRCPKRR